MNQYRNVKSGAVIKTTGKVIGKNWALIQEEPPEEQEKIPAEEVLQGEPAEEGTVEEAPAKKTKAAGKGKK